MIPMIDVMMAMIWEHTSRPHIVIDMKPDSELTDQVGLDYPLRSRFTLMCEPTMKQPKAEDFLRCVVM